MKIAIIGSGNVATQLGIAFKNCGHKIVCVCSRNIAHAKRLGQKLKTEYFDDLKKLSERDANIYLIAVKDDAITEIVRQMPALKNGMVIHTSGATDIAVLKNKFKNCGVLWQIQTIQLRTKTDFKNVPLVIEASNSSSKKKLMILAKSLSNKVYLLNSKQRTVLHLGAVWANNFTNLFYTIAEKILKQHHLPYEILSELILSTAKNGMKNPSAYQTGPALRNDK
jgi:predicted short-subunit dehydrogenase-like oxidoreductase (DUF2520 family)